MNPEKQNVKVTIEEAVEGGIVCTVCYGEDEDKKYVYKDIKKVARELPALFSVGEAEAPEEDEKSLEKMKSKINKKEY